MKKESIVSYSITLFVLILSLSLISATIDNGLVANYKFENNFLDSKGTYNILGHGASFTTGKIGSALSLNGNNSYVTLFNAFNQGTDSFSITAWINPSLIDSERNIIRKGLSDAGTPSNSGYGLVILGNKLLAQIRDDKKAAILTYNAGALLNKFSHVAMTIDRSSNTMSLFINGELVNSSSIEGIGNINTDLYLSIGALDRSPTASSPLVSGYFKGLIDELRIYNRALSSSEIKQVSQETNNSVAPKCSDFGYQNGSVGSCCDSQCTKYDLSSCYRTALTCTDLDGGQNYYNYSKVAVDIYTIYGNKCNSDQPMGGSAGRAEKLDKCEGSSIIEAICKGDNTFSTELYSCPNGCQNGACIPLSGVPVCGDSKVQEGEECDDGNALSGDGCSSTCLIEPPKAQCTDSDGGLNQYVYGWTNFKYGSTELKNEDVCILVLNYDSNGKPGGWQSIASCSGKDCYDEEAICKTDDKGNFIDSDANQLINCPQGCSNGACINKEPIPAELCESVSLTSASQKIFLGDSINKVRTVITKGELPQILASSIFGTNYQYVQFINLGTYPKITKEKQPTSNDDEQIGIKLSPTIYNPAYTAVIAFNRAVDFTDKTLWGEEINLFGESFLISPETGQSNFPGLILLRNAVKTTLTNDNPTESVSIAGKNYRVELLSASSASATVKITDLATGQSVSKEVFESNSKSLSNLIATLINSEASNFGLSATLIISTDRIRLGNGDSVTVGLDESVIDGTRTIIEGNINAVTKISIEVTAPNSDHDAILIGSEFVDPVFGTFKLIFDSYDDTNGAQIRIGGCTKDKPSSCTPQYTCKIEPTKCPSTGIQTKQCLDLKCNTGSSTKEDISCTPNECTGCQVGDKCIPYSYRAAIGAFSSNNPSSPSYCDIDGKIKEQKVKDFEGSWAKCQNNYECDSNLCSGGECVEVNDAIRRVGRFSGIFVRLVCRLANLFNNDDYNMCVGDQLGYSPVIDEWSNG